MHIESSQMVLELPAGAIPVASAAREVGMSIPGLTGLLRRAGKLIRYDGRHYVEREFLATVKQARDVLALGQCRESPATVTAA